MPIVISNTYQVNLNIFNEASDSSFERITESPQSITQTSRDIHRCGDHCGEVKQITRTNPERYVFHGMANTLCGRNKGILAEILYNAFSAVIDDMEQITIADSFTISQTIEPVSEIYTVTVTQVEKSLMKTNISKARGTDHIPNWILYYMT